MIELDLESFQRYSVEVVFISVDVVVVDLT